VFFEAFIAVVTEILFGSFLEGIDIIKEIVSTIGSGSLVSEMGF